jgi:hypothetical protein
MKPLPLPPNKSIVDVYVDFLKYLFSCAKTYVEETHANGKRLWNSVKDRIDYVITHPNGWESPQRANLRCAAVGVGLAKDGCMIQFLTEGEASLHFCIQNGIGLDILQVTLREFIYSFGQSHITKTGRGVIIVDAGGGTIDTSAFASNAVDGFNEISVAKCKSY